MDLRSEMSARRALQICQSRQRADGRLVTVLVIAAVVPTLRFVFSPSLGSAWVMGIFLFALGMACLRLLNSAALVVSIRDCSNPRFGPEIVEAEILDVYERPVALDAPLAQSTSAFWLATANDRRQLDPQQEFSSPLLRIGQGSYCRARNRGRC